MNARAVVCYLDDNLDQLKSFHLMVKSLNYIKVLNTDLVVFYNPSIDISTLPKKIYKHKIIYKIFYNEQNNNYKYLNSLECLVDQNFLLKYNLLLKTDVDVLFTESWNSFYVNLFTTGQGCYSNKDDVIIQEKINYIHEKLQLKKRENYQLNIGSTWYGASNLVLECARLATNITRIILDMFSQEDTNGKWPGWYRGVSTMYASEIAINCKVQRFVVSDKLDHPSTSTNKCHNHPHIHCWHTNKDFSKFKYYNDKYTDIKIEKLDITTIRDYCMFLGKSEIVNEYKPFIYIVVSPPRSGTTSICKMAEICGLNPMHVLSNISFSEAIHQYNFFADTPFYSPEFLIGLLQTYKNVKFIYITRSPEEIKQSMIKSGVYNYLSGEKVFSYMYDKLLIHDFIFLKNVRQNLQDHYNIMTKISNIYGIEMLSYNFADGWEPFCNFIDTNIPDVPIPHLNRSKS